MLPSRHQRLRSHPNLPVACLGIEVAIIMALCLGAATARAQTGSGGLEAEPAACRRSPGLVRFDGRRLCATVLVVFRHGIHPLCLCN